jgi:hypothetical protein
MSLRITLNLAPREVVLAYVAGTLAAAALLFVLLLRPAYDELVRQRQRVHAQRVELEQLQSNLAVGRDVEQIFATVAPAAVAESDFRIFSAFFRQIDQVRARFSSLRTVNLRSLEVQDAGPYRVYPARITVDGQLPEVVAFVTELTHRPSAIGIDGFSVRGTQGLGLVECTLSLRSVQVFEKGSRRSPGEHP